MGVTADIKLTVSGKHESDATGILSGVPNRSIAIPEFKQVYGDGTSANQVNAIIDQTRSVAGSPENLDLTGGLTDAFGNAVTFALIRDLIIRNRSETSGQDLELSGNFVTGALLADWVDDSLKIRVPPGGTFRLASPVDGFTVTGTLQDVLTVDPGANTISYDLVILGTK